MNYIKSFNDILTINSDGELVLKHALGHRKAGDLAACQTIYMKNSRYKTFALNGKIYKVAVVVYCMTYFGGEDLIPARKKVIHIDGNQMNYRIENLTIGTAAQKRRHENAMKVVNEINAIVKANPEIHSPFTFTTKALQEMYQEAGELHREYLVSIGKASQNRYIKRRRVSK